MGAKNGRQKRKCVKKVAYSTPAKATGVAIVATKRTGQQIWAYKCKYCAKFHVGHPSKKIVQAARDRKNSVS